VLVLRKSTSDSMVGVLGVWCTSAAGLSSMDSAGGAGVTTASTLAAKPDSVLRTKVSSPVGLSARNSSDAEPPIAPEVAATIT
jgi:hypothetical protein